MSASLYWQVSGQGPNLILLHGWGMNGAVWSQVAEKLRSQFRVHVVDLAGYGNSAACHADGLASLAELLLSHAPQRAFWVGWSLGGLLASYIAVHHSERVDGLITVASSPRFAASDNWRGIKPVVLQSFSQQLKQDFQLTIERFMALQTMGTPSAREDVKRLKQAVLSRPAPQAAALQSGLNMLANVDLRADMAQLTMPVLRLYGRLDGLVPVQVATDMAQILPLSAQYIFHNSSHAPFITEEESFCNQLVKFCNK